MTEPIPPGYKRTEIGIIPEDWEVKRLGDVGEITGAGVDKKIRKNEIRVRLLNYMDIYKKDFLYNKEINFWTTTPQEKIEQCSVKKGDVFFTPSSEMQTDIAHSAVAMEDMPGVVYSYHIVRFRLKENWDLKFRTYIFKTRDFLKQAETYAEGSGKRYVISLKKFREFEIYYPPDIEEQRAIARVLSDFDRLIEALDELIEKKKMIKKGTMQELLTGKKRLPGFTGEWVRKRLGEVVDIVGGGTPDTKNPKYWGGEINWFTPTEIGKSKYVSESERKITDEGLKHSSAKILPIGSILFTSRATIGEVAILRKEATTNQGFQSLIPKNIDNEFLYYLLIIIKRKFITKANGSTFLEITPSVIKDIELSLPPTLEEQHAIARVLSDMDAEIEALEQKKEKYEMMKKGAMELLLTGKVRLKNYKVGDEENVVEE